MLCHKSMSIAWDKRAPLNVAGLTLTPDVAHGAKAKASTSSTSITLRIAHMHMSEESAFLHLLQRAR